MHKHLVSGRGKFVATCHATVFREAARVNMQRRRLLQLALAGVATVFLPACRNGTSMQALPGGAPGDRFPDIDLPYLDGRKGIFADDVAVPLIVNFWATWCEPCRREMPSLEKLSTLFPPGELMVIGIAADNDVNLAREFSLQYRLTFPLLSDGDQELSREVLGIPAFPATYLLRRDRTIASIIAGERDWTEPGMIEEIEGLLAVRRIRAT